MRDICQTSGYFIVTNNIEVVLKKRDLKSGAAILPAAAIESAELGRNAGEFTFDAGEGSEHYELW